MERDCWRIREGLDREGGSRFAAGHTATNENLPHCGRVGRALALLQTFHSFPGGAWELGNEAMKTCSTADESVGLKPYYKPFGRSLFLKRGLGDKIPPCEIGHILFY